METELGTDAAELIKRIVKLESEAKDLNVALHNANRRLNDKTIANAVLDELIDKLIDKLIDRMVRG